MKQQSPFSDRSERVVLVVIALDIALQVAETFPFSCWRRDVVPLGRDWNLALVHGRVGRTPWRPPTA